MIGRITVDRRDKPLVYALFQECERLIHAHTKHPGFSAGVRFYFSFDGLTLRREQELRNLVRDWASTSTSSLAANAEAGDVSFSRSTRWDSFFDGKFNGGGFSMMLHCPGISLSDAEGLHRLLETMYDDAFYVAFDIETPEPAEGYPYTREFSC